MSDWMAASAGCAGLGAASVATGTSRRFSGSVTGTRTFGPLDPARTIRPRSTTVRAAAEVRFMGTPSSALGAGDVGIQYHRNGRASRDRVTGRQENPTGSGPGGYDAMNACESDDE